MSSLRARTGRHRQRYKDHFRLVAGCIPYKLEQNVVGSHSNSEKKLLVLMISTPGRDDLVFPKGGWEDDETKDEAASREALEEAGVKGTLSENPIGVWEFRSKSKQNSSSLEGGCRGYMFALKVTEELDSWPEKDKYDRKWLTTEEAYEFCRYDWMREALGRFLATLSAESPIRMSEESKEIPLRPVTDAGEELQMSSPGYFGKPSGVQHLGNTCCKCVV
ncbi:nudix hydrolase 12, mitochondrial-like [Juglans microcarpa x Juglans regia]|uniref:nudix hydrolase 12, mitochondrial-like n=1 Tax=Juglans microcarpa x Juglans regia TaxID=2249226 RepID=UPI001B7E2B06|nr:nudix hydrolase 12, mitochondrial-like [Juglans microcarpa x Juglans regia]